MTMKAWLSSTSQSSTSTMPGCRINEVARASVKKRSITDSLAEQLGEQHLDRHPPGDALVLGQKDLAHPPPTEQPNHGVPADATPNRDHAWHGMHLVRHTPQNVGGAKSSRYCCGRAGPNEGQRRQREP